MQFEFGSLDWLDGGRLDWVDGFVDWKGWFTR